MVGKAQMTISEARIDNITPTQSQSSIGHTFEMRATLKVAKRKGGLVSGQGIDYPELEWIETIDWFKHLPDGSWTYVGTDRKDMYHDNPASNTFSLGAWRDSRYFIASADHSNHPPPGLVDAVSKVHSAADKDKAAKHWIAENGFEWTLSVALDSPALGLKPSASSGGGGGSSLVTSNSRRRVIHFDLGFKGSSNRVTATQILETVNGKPTIHRFFPPPGISKADADNPNKLATWRT